MSRLQQGTSKRMAMEEHHIVMATSWRASLLEDATLEDMSLWMHFPNLPKNTRVKKSYHA